MQPRTTSAIPSSVSGQGFFGIRCFLFRCGFFRSRFRLSLYLWALAVHALLSSRVLDAWGPARGQERPMNLSSLLPNSSG